MKHLKFTLLLLALAASPIWGDSTSAAHGDHNPRHGGQLFMAPDGVHHLEGALASTQEFRVYFYDAHTRALPARGFLKGAKIMVQRVDKEGMETGAPVPLAVAVDKENSYLTSAIPKEYKTPLYFTVVLSFPNQKEPGLFNFNFASVSHGHAH